MENLKTIFEKSQEGQKSYSLPKSDSLFEVFLPPEELLRDDGFDFSEVSEIDLTRHFSLLERKNMGIDTNFYPLGSCTMKLNPRVCEDCAALKGFTNTHPLAPEETVEGNLRLIKELLKDLCQICGMTAATQAPNAGAQGEFVGLKLIRSYHEDNGDYERDEILVPDNAHGTNPASASLAGFKPVTIQTDFSSGDIDIDSLKEKLSKKTAGLMLTNPNTLGLFSSNILTITELVHQAGGLLYYDGANLNPILNIARPGDMGFDVMHINLHKTFSTPHGGGGPGGAPVLCNDKLKSFLPMPRVDIEGDHYKTVWDTRESIGRIAPFFGNFGILVRAYLYIKLHGHFGLRRIAENSVLNANYLKHYLKEFFTIPFSSICMHEFVVQATNYLDKGITALDIAKRLLDYGIHAPTIYFPLIIKECLLIEPTETESLETLDYFISVMRIIVEEIHKNPDLVLQAPHNLLLSRPDEVLAAREPVLKS